MRILPLAVAGEEGIDVMSITHGTSVFAAVLTRTWKKTLRRPVALTFSLFQPLMWMLFFGFLMQRYPLSDLPANLSYTSFLAPGICAMTVLFGASQSGIGLIRDIQTGFLQRMLATPASRFEIHSGKVIADCLRLMAQAGLVALIAVLVGASLHFTFLPLLCGALALFLFALGFASLSSIVALRTGRQETMATFVHLVNMPLFFTSTALVPGKQMPDWLAMVASWNPLTLAVESLRGALLFQQMPDYAGQLLPLFLLALVLTLWAVVELGNADGVSAWDAR
jgi:ABC-2 type transport system permease protein